MNTTTTTTQSVLLNSSQKMNTTITTQIMLQNCSQIRNTTITTQSMLPNRSQIMNTTITTQSMLPNCSQIMNTTEAVPFICTVNTETMVYMCIYSLVIFLVVTGNAYILIKLNPFKNIRRPNIEVLLVYLSIFDLMSSIMLSVDVYENLTCFEKWPFGQIGCKIIYPLYHLSLNMSVCILILMSIDRCRSIVTPMKKKFTRRSIHIAVTSSLVISISLLWYQFNGWNLHEGTCYAKKVSLLYSISSVAITLTRDITFIYVFTITTMLIYASISINDIKEIKYAERKKKETRRVIKMLIIMEVVFTLLVVPYDVYDAAQFMSVWIYGKPHFTKVIYHIDRILSILQMSNSFANCFIYAKMHRYIRMRNASTPSSSEYHGERRETKPEVIWTNHAYQPD